jgi:hypothetical protein
MPLKQTSWILSDATGTPETISIDASNTTIAGVSYGTDAAGAPIPVQISTDNKSFEIKVISGSNPLIVTLISPGPDNDIVYVQQKTPNGAADLDSFVIYRQEVWDPMIQGT